LFTNGLGSRILEAGEAEQRSPVLWPAMQWEEGKGKVRLPGDREEREVGDRISNYKRLIASIILGQTLGLRVLAQIMFTYTVYYSLHKVVLNKNRQVLISVQ
jgi:hypothetical protein